MRRKKLVCAVLDGIFMLPLVFPPALTSFLFLCLLGIQKNVDGTEIVVETDLVQGWKGCLIAFVLIAFPLMYRNARDAFDQINQNMIYVGRTLGMSEYMLFIKVILPLSIREIFYGSFWAFFRVLGEYGAAAMLLKNIAGEGLIVFESGSSTLIGEMTLSEIVGICVVFAVLLAVYVFSVMSGRRMKTRRWI